MLLQIPAITLTVIGRIRYLDIGAIYLEEPTGYPAQPRLIRLSVRPSVRTCLQIRYSATNGTGPTD